MRRDMELVRRILLTVEGREEEELRASVLRIDGFDDALVARHVEIMKEAGLLDAHVLSADNVPPYAARVFRLTWEGHDFLEATRSERVWAKTKQLLAEKGAGASFAILKAVAIRVAKDQIGLEIQ